MVDYFRKKRTKKAGTKSKYMYYVYSERGTRSKDKLNRRPP